MTATILALRINLDQYTSLWTTVQAAEYFWVVFALAAVAAAVGLWSQRPNRPHHHR